MDWEAAMDIIAQYLVRKHDDSTATGHFTLAQSIPRHEQPFAVLLGLEELGIRRFGEDCVVVIRAGRVAQIESGFDMSTAP